MIVEERKVGPKGQVVIPKMFRKHLGIEPGEEVKVTISEEKVVIEKKKKNIMQIMEKTATYSEEDLDFDSNKNYEEMMEKRWKKST